MKKTRYIKDIIKYLLELEELCNKYRINNDKIISFKDLKLLNIHGNEYVVFKYNDKIIKIHRKNFVDIDNFDKDNILSLIGIPTERILMPTDIVYNIENNPKGYVMDYVNNKKSIANESIRHIIDESRMIENDKKILDEKRIVLQDLHEGNAIYNGNIYIVDSGRFINTNIMLPTYMFLFDGNNMRLFRRSDIKELNKMIIQTNSSQINYFIYRFIMNAILEKKSDFEKYIYMKECLSYFKESKEKLKTDSFVDVIEKEISSDMTVEEYGKTLIKKVKY